MKKENYIIAINACNKIIDIFLGPFLTAYFIKTNIDSLNDLSFYKILCFSIIAIVTILIGPIIKKNHGLGTLRLGIVLRLFYILTIIILKENIINHIFLIATMWGVSAGAFFAPFNLYNLYAIDNTKREAFESRKISVNNLISIIIPFFLGTIITTTSYQITAIIVLFISVTEIVLSFFIKKLPIYNSEFNIKKVLCKTFKNKDKRRIAFYEMLTGLCIGDSALTVVITVLIINAFEKDIILGIINSSAAIVAIIFINIYSKYIKKKFDEIVIWLIGFVVIAFSILFVYFNNSNVVVIYSIIFEAFAVSFLSLVRSVTVNNYLNKKITKEEINEFMVLRELFLNIGRILSFILLSIIIAFKVIPLNYLTIIFSILIILFIDILIKIKKNLC